MSNSLTSSFNNLTVAARPAPRIQLTIPQRETNGRLMFYGIETTESWLVNYTKIYRKDYDLPVCVSNMLNLSYALWLLKIQSGINSLEFETVLPDGAPIPPARKGHRQSLPLPKCGPPIIAICSSESRSFQKRPSQAQVDVLKQIMDGKEPRWWVNDADRR